MQTVPLGRTGINVSRISFGTAPLGFPYGLTSNSPENMLPADQALELLNTALDGGINFFDTARLYGRSEQLLGQAFAHRRADVVIATKCEKDMFDDHDKLLPPDQLRRKIRTSLQQSLKTLKTDYLDVLLIHHVTDEVLDSAELPDIFQQLKRDGLVRAVGMSTYALEQTERVITSGAWDVVQLAYNLLDQTHARALPLAQQHGVGIMVRSVLFKGILTDAEINLHPELKPVQDYRNRYRELLTPETPTLTQLAAKFVLSHPAVSSALLGIDRMNYLQEAIAITRAPQLDPGTLARAQRLAFPDPDFLDLPAWDRKGWLH